MRSLDHLGRSSEAKDRKNPKKVECDGRTDGRTDGWTDGQTDGRMDGRTDGWTDGPTKQVVESRSTRLKNSFQVVYEHVCMKGIELKD